MKQLINSLVIAVAVLFAQNVLAQTNNLTATNRLTAAQPTAAKPAVLKAVKDTASKLQGEVTVTIGQAVSSKVHNKVVNFKVGYSVQSTYDVPVRVNFTVSAYDAQGNMLKTITRWVLANPKTATDGFSDSDCMLQKFYTHIDHWEVKGVSVYIIES